MDIQNFINNDEFLKKNFTIDNNNNLQCKKIHSYGSYNYVLSEYIAIYRYLKSIIKDKNILMNFENAVIDQMKDIEMKHINHESSVVEGEDVLIF